MKIKILVISPLRLYHSRKDERIPFSDSRHTFQVMQAAGAQLVEFEELAGNNHFHALFDFLATILAWFETFEQTETKKIPGYCPGQQIDILISAINT